MYLQDTRVVGPFLPSPARPLPNELDRFMQEAGDEGVILVSFGTVLEEVDETLLQLMAKAFSKLPQKIVWRLKGMSTKTVRVKIINENGLLYDSWKTVGDEGFKVNSYFFISFLCLSIF